MNALLTPTDLDVILRNDLMTFIEGSFYELYPQAVFSDSPHIQVMASKLADCMTGKCKRLIINLPPRSLKSHSVSVAFVAWMLGHDPTKQIICSSYGQDLAEKHARDTRSIMASPFYKRIFPSVRLSTQKQAVNDFMTTKQGFRMATSVGGVLTGRGGDIMIIDDPLKPDDALSESQRGSANAWFDNTLLSRLNSKENGVIIIVMQRLHQDDLVGHVLEQGNWEVLSFSAIAVEDERHVVNTPFGPFVYERKLGEVLNPKRESLNTLLEIKRTIGEYNFASQYQQDPMPIGGAMIKTEWIRYYRPEERPLRFDTVVQSWDTANKSGDLNDYSVCTTWGVFNRKFYLLDVFRRRLNYPDLKRAVREQMLKHHPNDIVIEDRASGTQLIQELKYEGIYCVRPYDPPSGTDKVMRLHNQTAKFENGLVYLPVSALWLSEYLRELISFPGSKYDDQVDSTVQALDYLKRATAMEIWARLGR